MKKITLLMFALMGAFSLSAQTTIWEDGFENYADFEIDNIGGWTQIDNDGGTTYGAQGYNFTNETYAGTGIVFNPSAAPSDPAGTFASDSPVWQVKTGDKGIYFFASSTPPNDDYLISPQIDLSGATATNLSFWAKSLTDQYGLEEFEILLSTTGTSQSDFTVNLSGGIVEPPIDVYTEYTYDLSAYDGQQIYIAIHYVGNDHFVLQMDDFSIQGTLGIAEHQIAGFDHYYNASTKDLVLSADQAFSQANLYNILGQQVISKKLSSTDETINLSSLETGVYLVNVEVNGQMSTFKIVKR